LRVAQSTASHRPFHNRRGASRMKERRRDETKWDQTRRGERERRLWKARIQAVKLVWEKGRRLGSAFRMD